MVPWAKKLSSRSRIVNLTGRQVNNPFCLTEVVNKCRRPAGWSRREIRAQAVAQRSFREDLFYRLNVFPIRIPPLRERGVGDITKLTHFFLKRRKGAAPNLTSAAIETLAAHDWPGNVRELENSIQRALNLLEDEVLDVQHISLPARPNKRLKSKPGTLRDMERDAISATLEQTGANMAATAKKLGISRMTLYRKVKQYEIG